MFYCGRLIDESSNGEDCGVCTFRLQIQSPMKIPTSTPTPMQRHNQVRRTLVARRLRRRDFSAGVSLGSRKDSRLIGDPSGHGPLTEGSLRKKRSGSAECGGHFSRIPDDGLNSHSFDASVFRAGVTP